MTFCSQGRNAYKGTLSKSAGEVLASISSPFLPPGNIISYINLYKVLEASGVWEGEMKRGEGLEIRESEKEVNDKIPELGLV